MGKQKFKRGDLVRVAKDLGPMMSHFTADCDAIVIGSYADQFGEAYGGGEDRFRTYTIFIRAQGETSWYYESQLTFIRHDPEMLETWKAQRKERITQAKDIKWIHTNWQDHKAKLSPATILACMDLVGFDTSFHRNGEYFVLVDDWRQLFPFMDRLMTAKIVEDLKGPDGEVSELAAELFNKLQSKLRGMA